MPYTFTIIGGGLTATSMLVQVVEKLTNMGSTGRSLSRQFSIVIFEKEHHFGPGLPHNEKYLLPIHITNMCARDMSVVYANPTDFQQWVMDNYKELQENHPSLSEFTQGTPHVNVCYHYPRAIMGEYLTSRFHDAINTAQSLGISIELLSNHEIIDLFESDGRIVLTGKPIDGSLQSTYVTDTCLLATGHWFASSNSENFLPSPWPASQLLQTIPPGRRVGVFGSSLSAIEVALTLTSDGHFTRLSSSKLKFSPSNSTRQITLYSRNGLFPRVRGKIGKRSNLFLTCSNILELIKANPFKLKLSVIFELLDRELTEVYGASTKWRHIIHPQGGAEERLREDLHNARWGDGPDGELLWQTILVEIFPVARDVYINLAPTERELFDKSFNTLFFMHAATQPIINGEKLLALLEAGVVSITRLGKNYRFQGNSSGKQFTFSYTDSQGTTLQDLYEYVVNACGQPRSLGSDDSRLTRNLLRRKIAQIDNRMTYDSVQSFESQPGTMLIDPATHRLVVPSVNSLSFAQLPVFAVGAMTRSQIIDASMSQGIAKSTCTVAHQIIEQLRLHVGKNK